MELWDAYNADGSLAGIDLVRGERIPLDCFHLVCEAIIQHTDEEYLLIQRSLKKEIYPGKWEVGAGGSALKGENKIQAILREIKEETGIDSGELKELYNFVHAKHQAIYCGFILVTSFNKNSIQLQADEAINYKWVSRRELIEFYDGNQCSDSSKERLKDFIDSIRKEE